MTLLEISIWVSLFLVLVGNLVFALILFQRRFHKAAFYMPNDSFNSYKKDLQRIIKKVNGWLYLLIFFNCVNYSCGPWSFIFSMLCFLASSSGENNLVAFCSVFAAISASTLLFSNPSKRHNAANQAWKQSQSKLEVFVIKWRAGGDAERFKDSLEELSEELSEISEKTDL